MITKFLQRDLVKPDEVKFSQKPGFSLPCEASGSNLTWTWKHNGITITVFYGPYYSLSQSGTLTGNYLTAEQSGSYQCFVKDEVTGIQVFSRKLQVAVTGECPSCFYFSDGYFGGKNILTFNYGDDNDDDDDDCEGFPSIVFICYGHVCFRHH